MINKKIAVISVVYENYTVLPDFLSSLQKQLNQNFHLFLADLSNKKKAIKNPVINNQQSTILFGSNKGYAYGINLGLKKAIDAGIEKFCILNSDVFFEEDFIDKCLKSIDNYPSSIIGGKIYYAPGFEYHKNRYKEKNLGKVIWYAGGDVDWQHATTPHRGVDQVDRGQFDKPSKINFVTGALMLFDKSVVEKIGFWDEAYFLYFEDADFCQRAKKAGISLFYDPTVVIWHKNAQSTGGSGSILHQKYQKVSRLRFGLKYAPWNTKLHLIKNYFLC